MARWPATLVEIGTADAARLGIASGDLVELYNDYGSTQGMAHIEPSIREGHVFMMAMGKQGVMGDLVTNAIDENVLPYYKGTWAAVRRLGDAGYSATVTQKSRHY
jgi:arsenite oxidase large subunit